MNLLNEPSNPCTDATNKINVGQCIARGMEKKLNCTVPDTSSVDTLSTIKNLSKKLCSTAKEFSDFNRNFSLHRYTEKTLYEQFGCTAKCQG